MTCLPRASNLSGHRLKQPPVLPFSVHPTFKPPSPSQPSSHIMTDVKSETIETAAGGITHSPAGPKAIIKNVDMNEELQQESVDITNAALEKYNIEKDIAAHIKKEFDRRYGATWHVVVGKNFGSYVTHGLSSFFLHASWGDDSSTACRNQTFHLLLRRTACDPHLEIIDRAGHYHSHFTLSLGHG